MADRIAAGALFAFFGNRTGAFARVATVGLDLPEGSHWGPAAIIGFVLHFGPVWAAAERLPILGPLLAQAVELSGSLLPKLSAADASPATAPGRRRRIDPGFAPPCGFIATAMDLTMMAAAQRHGEFVADFSPECAVLGEPQMMGIGGPATANQTRLFGHELDVVPVTKAARLRMDQLALVDAVGRRMFLRRALRAAAELTKTAAARI